MNTYDKIKDSLKEAKISEYTNGMATKSIDIKTSLGDISVIRKSANPDRNEHYLIRVKANQDMGHLEANRIEIAKKIKHMSIVDNTDINIIFKNHYPDDGYNYSAIVPVDIFTF